MVPFSTLVQLSGSSWWACARAGPFAFSAPERRKAAQPLEGKCASQDEGAMLQGLIRELIGGLIGFPPVCA
jgi:hypothetical protein